MDEPEIRPPFALKPLRRRRGLVWLGIYTAGFSLCTAIALLSLAPFVEWKIATSDLHAGALAQETVFLAMAVPAVAIVLLALATPPVLAYGLHSRRVPLPVLASRARQIAAGARVAIPYQGKDNEIGDLANALREWQEAAALREVLLRSAPVCICQLDATGAILSSNETTWTTLDYKKEALEGRQLVELVHPDDVHLVERVSQTLAAPGADRATAEVRLRRGDGSWLWCSAVVAPVSREGRSQDGFILILEDISERKRQVEWAAAVQREMLPAVPPPLPGYELAGRCLPAQEVAGDLYDWEDTGDGYLELTVADVMGKGMGAALVMAALRSALRAAPGELGPAERVSRAAASMTFGAETESLFVTLFHARLELATGRLRYVDAGHGYCLIRRAGGEIERLAERTMPVGVETNDGFKEGEARLEPGDLLLVCSDGLVERDRGMLTLEELASELEPTENAAESLERLLRAATGAPIDDVTILLLQRLATSPIG